MNALNSLDETFSCLGCQVAKCQRAWQGVMPVGVALLDSIPACHSHPFHLDFCIEARLVHGACSAHSLELAGPQIWAGGTHSAMQQGDGTTRGWHDYVMATAKVQSISFIQMHVDAIHFFGSSLFENQYFCLCLNYLFSY